MTHGDITMKKIATADNVVDMLTKPIPVLKFAYFDFPKGFKRKSHEEILCCDLIKFK